ncbi:hypothetical protein [Streptomyces sp. NPDC059452]|uniref:hypothetical protein n=1 Tax=Streptomyces sp. NPDC059452 TaxID=3346835 RepID=UPI0036ADFAFB
MPTPTHDDTEGPAPRWAVPPEGGWTADDLDTLPNLPRHTELIDGSLVTGAYTSTGIFHDRMKVSVPFPVDLDLTALEFRSRAADPE